MNDTQILNEINRLNFEDFLWGIFALLCLINIYGDYNDKEYSKTHNNIYKTRSNEIFELTIIVTFFIYVYFFFRNYNFYIQASNENKNLYLIKLLGSSFFIAGILCLLYFQIRQQDFIGSPAL